MNDRRIRIIGAIIFAVVHYSFFMVELLVSIPDTPHLVAKTIFTTLLFVLTQWEPTRWVLIRTYRKWGYVNNIKRKCVNAAILIPFAFFVEAGRIQVDTLTDFWTSNKLPDWSIYLINFRVSLIFVFLQVVFYECFFAAYERGRTERQAEQLKRLNLQMQYDSLKVQIQPHFLFNTLNTLIALIPQDRNRAVRFTEELAFVYRYFLNANEKTVVPVQEEIDFTIAYYYLFKTRYPEGLSIHFPEELDALENYCIPPLSLQLLVENAIKHNIVSTNRPLKITMEFDAKRESIVVRNNLQRKKRTNQSGKGLIHLKKKFILLQLPVPSVVEDAEYYTVTVPLVRNNVILDVTDHINWLPRASVQNLVS